MQLIKNWWRAAREWLKSLDKGRIPSYVWIATLIFLAAVASFYGLSKVKKYEETTYDTAGYAKAKNQIDLILRVRKACKGQDNERINSSCKAATDAIKNFAQLDDLAAQETMARATRGLLWVGWLQFAATAFTLSFVVWAVVQGHQMSQHAATAAKASRDANRAHVYLSLIHI